MKLCSNYLSSILNSCGVNPIVPNVAPLAVLTFKVFVIILILSYIFLNIFCDIHKHVAPVSNRPVIGSVLGILTQNLTVFTLHILN